MVRYEWTEWTSITKCVSNSCMIPAKGVRIVARSCTSHMTNKFTGLILKGVPNKLDKICSGRERSVQLCTRTSSMEGCSKLMTPSQFASNKCAKYQVNMFYNLYSNI